CSELLALTSKVVLGDGPEGIICGFFCKGFGVVAVCDGLKPFLGLVSGFRKTDSAYSANSSWGGVLVSRVAGNKHEGLAASIGDTNSKSLNGSVPHQHSFAFRCGGQGIDRSRRQRFFRFHARLQNCCPENGGTTSGQQVVGARMQRDATKKFSLHRQVAIFKGLFRIQRVDLRRDEIPCNISPQLQPFGSRSAAPARRARAPRYWSTSACG